MTDILALLFAHKDLLFALGLVALSLIFGWYVNRNKKIAAAKDSDTKPKRIRKNKGKRSRYKHI